MINMGMHGTAVVGVPAEVLATPAPDLHGTLLRLQAQLGPHMDPLARWVMDPLTLATATTEHATQKWWAEQVSTVQRQRLESKGPVRDRTRLACQKGPVATGWLQALPSRRQHTEIPDAEFRLLLRWWRIATTKVVAQTTQVVAVV